RCAIQTSGGDCRGPQLVFRTHSFGPSFPTESRSWTSYSATRKCPTRVLAALATAPVWRFAGRHGVRPSPWAEAPWAASGIQPGPAGAGQSRALARLTVAQTPLGFNQFCAMERAE